MVASAVFLKVALVVPGGCDGTVGDRQHGDQTFWVVWMLYADFPALGTVLGIVFNRGSRAGVQITARIDIEHLETGVTDNLHRAINRIAFSNASEANLGSCLRQKNSLFFFI